MADALLEARAVSRSFLPRGGILRRRTGTITAVDHVSCSLKPGQTLGLVGESGSGKTTLAKLLIGLLMPTSGEVFVQGHAWSRLRGEALRAARRAVQFIFQDPTNSLNPRMNIEEILSEPLRIHRLAVGAAARRRRVDELLESVHLPATYRHRLPRELSGGERQRGGIARALATNPEALICDEPIASLDVSIGAQILELLRTLTRARRTALLFVSHDLRAVAALCDEIAVMKQGRIIETGPTDQLLNRPRDPYTELLIRCAELDLDAPTVDDKPQTTDRSASS